MFLKSLNPLRRIRELAQELRRTREEGERIRRRNEELEQEIGQLEQQKGRLEQESERLRDEIKKLRNQLEAAYRAAKRQAAPFSRGQRKSNPKPPGRKPGKGYGQDHHRPIRNHVDEQIAVPVPDKCPACGSTLIVERTEAQYQEEIVRRTWIRRFDIPICRCVQCGKRVQGRHPLQASDALGAAAVQVGPEALTLGVLMNKAQGLPHADAAAILKQGFHLQMSRSGICRAIQRVARKAEATWHALRDAARRSQLAHMDETGWKVEAQLHWLWAVVTEQITYCQILPGRGFDEAKSILGAEWAGWLIHDGLQLYYKFLKAAHQSCAAHLIRRCRDLIAVYAHGGAFSVGGERNSGARTTLTGPLSGEEDHTAWIVDGHGPAGSQIGPPADQDLSGPSQSATGQAFRPRTPLPVHVSLLSGLGGCDQQPSGTRDADLGDDPQELGWQPHGKRGAGTMNLH